jgi:hypothetical protein
LGKAKNAAAVLKLRADKTSMKEEWVAAFESVSSQNALRGKRKSAV